MSEGLPTETIQAREDAEFRAIEADVQAMVLKQKRRDRQLLALSAALTGCALLVWWWWPPPRWNPMGPVHWVSAGTASN